MNLIGLARLGRDIEIRHLADGTAVGNLYLAFNYGKKGKDGKRLSQWIDASIFGDRATKLVEYLVKGTQVFVILSDPHIETYEKKDGGSGVKLAARVDSLEFASSSSNDAQQTKPESRPESKDALAGLDDDIPFN
jgi:single-strand DNA-binding protein